MASVALSMKHAAEKWAANWDLFDVATKAACAIAEDCNDRRGLHVDACDDEVQAIIIDSWAQIIRATIEQE